jgi:hypothetical protein
MSSDILTGTTVTGAEIMDVDHVALAGPDGPDLRAETPRGGIAYEDFFPYYAELCALSELRKKPGFGVPLRSGAGGHALLYLNGVRLDRAAGYPVLRLCTEDEPAAERGAGISVNSHYSNANWVAVEGRDFLWRGALAPGENLTREAYERTQAAAKARGCLDGVEFHRELFNDKPAGMSDYDYMYEISVATDFGAQFGRDSFRARVPLDRARMGAIVDYLNAANAPYRAGQRLYRWKLLNDNCVHLTHNALAAGGVWAPSRIGQFFAFAAFCFPVPKNEFVDLVLRGNDLPLADAQALYEDDAARAALLRWGALPTAPGALASTVPAIACNEIYDIDRLRLIFYDNRLWGPYHNHFKRIFSSPRYTGLHENFRHFAALYATAQARRPGRHLGGQRALFEARYDEHLSRARAELQHHLARLEGAP